MSRMCPDHEEELYQYLKNAKENGLTFEEMMTGFDPSYYMKFVQDECQSQE